MVDTYEHILRHDLKVQSRLVLGYGQAREGSIKTLRLSEWLHELFEYLQAKGWRIVMAGREVPRSKPDDQLPRFSRDEILQAARIRPALAEYLPAQESAIASVLSTLSFEGNPLWLQVAMNLLENLLAEGKDLAQLAQQPEYLHECFETDDPFDTGAYDGIEHGRCKLTLINTLTRHIGDLEDQAWKIALPRVLDKGIVMQLFAPQQANAILHNFKLAGVFRVAGQQFTLHEEIRDLLLAYARSKGWLDTDETRALHGKLWDYLTQCYQLQIDEAENFLFGGKKSRTNASDAFSAHQFMEQVFPRIWILEASYHRCLSGIGLIEKGVSPHSFAYALMGSASLTAVEKWQIANQLPSLSVFQISELMRIFDEETKQWEGVFGREVTTRLLLDIAEGKVGNIGADVAYWEQQVRLHGLCGDFCGLYSALNETEANSGRLVEVVDEMLSTLWRFRPPRRAGAVRQSTVLQGRDAGEQARRPAGRGGGVRQPAATLWRFRRRRRAGAVRYGAGQQGLDAGEQARRPAGRGGGVRQPAATLWRFRRPRRAGAVRQGTAQQGRDAGRKARRPAGCGGGVRQPAATLWRVRPPRRAGAVRQGAGQQGRDAGRKGSTTRRARWRCTTACCNALASPPSPPCRSSAPRHCATRA